MTKENIIRFIEQHKRQLPISKMTPLFGRSRSTFYRNRKLKPLSLTSVEERIHQLVQENHFLFGYRKIHALLSREFTIGINKVARIMKHRGWNCIAKIKKYRHTGPQHKAFDNLIQKNWNAKRPLQKLTTDITYLPFGSSMLYLSTIMDMFNSEIVAYKISSHPDTNLVIDTFNQLDDLPKQAVLHSDQGSTYTAKKFCDLVKQKTLSKVCPVRELLQITHQ